MFKGAYQKKLLTILYSGGSNPLEIWDIQVKNGWTRRVKDEDMGNIVFEIAGTNVATAYIVTPPQPRGVLGITLPFITMFIKNLKRYFTFEIQILDDKQMRRRFRFSNYQSATKVRPFACSVPLALKPGWNQMQLNLANFTMRAYGTNYLETQRVQIHANCRIRRVYFSDRLYTDEELPREYRVHLDPRTVKSTVGAPMTEKVSSILKKPTAAEEESSPKPPTPESQENLLKETSYGTTGVSNADQISSGVSLVKDLPSAINLGSQVSGVHSDAQVQDSLTREPSQKSHVEIALDESSKEMPEDVHSQSKEMPAAAVTEEQAPTEEPTEVPEDPVTEDDLSPRTDSEFAESEPITESDAELAAEYPTTDVDEDKVQD